MFNLRFTPEMFFMLPVALFIDFCGLGLVVFGLDDLGLLDIAGVLIFFPWLILKGKSTPSLSGRKSGENIKKLFKGKSTKLVTPLVGEISPWIGGLGFFWTLSVLCNLGDQ